MTKQFEITAFAACEIINCLKLRIDFIRESGFDKDSLLSRYYLAEIKRLQSYIDELEHKL